MQLRPPAEIKTLNTQACVLTAVLPRCFLLAFHAAYQTALSMSENRFESDSTAPASHYETITLLFLLQMKY